MLKIGDIELKNPVVLAPMAGVCNPAFRLIAKEFGAGLVCAEMVADRGIVNQNKKSLQMLHVEDREKPMSLQIFGGSKDSLVEAAKYVDQYTNADIIDINMGCPVPKITKTDAGAKWLLEPEKIHEMVSAVVKNVGKPVTIKMRKGWDDNHIYAVQNAQAAEQAGALSVALHGRTRVQMYEGEADWAILKDVKDQVNIPVIGNGDVATPEDAKKMLELTGVDGVMIGRGALGNPWMLYRTVQYLETGDIHGDPSPQEKIDVCLLHLDRLAQHKGEAIAVKEMHKHAAWYLKGMRGSNNVRKKINQTENAADLKAILYDYIEQMDVEHAS
ncbi:tRNA dihydrouridine synthase DusB [Tuberibacillus sp. Marseille-P3662]|uniref:tRNA dihydrouridine synthase DusB n=1 Tax=Tuberibacillus sp. Marseille-P3662 TaxID=1965358 RepID=UPI000A1CB8D9|nr:tRNA dihydrouridine synthase DusB [Tuberibacillus sp. Marseille-P3662]